MAIKKALYGRQPGCFYFWFSLCPLAVTRDLVFSLVSGSINKVPSFTYLGMKKLYMHSEILFQHESVHGIIFHSYSVTPNELIFLLQLFILCMHDFFQNFYTYLSLVEKCVSLLLIFWTDSVPFCLMHSLNF